MSLPKQPNNKSEDRSLAGDPVIRDGESVLLRGTQNGLEIHIDSSASTQEVFVSLNEKLEASPSFFSGARVTVRYTGAPMLGMLARLEDIAERYQLTIVSVRSAGDELKNHSAPKPQTKASVSDGAEAEQAAYMPMVQDTEAPRFLSGPIRSGSVLEFQNHVVIVGDVNPGAEIISRGSIIVLGRLRGVAHAGALGGAGFILALDLTPQQLRIGKLVARAGEEESTNKTEIAYATQGGICVNEFTGKLPAEILTAKL